MTILFKRYYEETNSLYLVYSEDKARVHGIQLQGKVLMSLLKDAGYIKNYTDLYNVLFVMRHTTQFPNNIVTDISVLMPLEEFVTENLDDEFALDMVQGYICLKESKRSKFVNVLIKIGNAWKKILNKNRYRNNDRYHLTMDRIGKDQRAIGSR